MDDIGGLQTRTGFEDFFFGDCFAFLLFLFFRPHQNKKKHKTWNAQKKKIDRLPFFPLGLWKAAYF